MSDLLVLLERWLPTPVIDHWVQETGRRFYTRLLPPLLVLWGLIFQRVNSDHTCDAAWSYLTSDAVHDHFGLSPLNPAHVSESTSAYCQARARLPESVAHGALQATAGAFDDELGEVGLWRGYRVNLIDGSTLRLPATAALREHYGGPTNQKGASH